MRILITVRDALEKLQVNDASLIFEPETSVALGFGFSMWFFRLTPYGNSSRKIREGV